MFAPYPMRPWTEPCLHCYSVAEEQAVHSRPLRGLSAEDLAGFAAGSAVGVWGELVDFKHLLPRLFEILVTDGFVDGPVPIETLVGALRLHEWHVWPTHEQDALEQFLQEWWRSHLSAYPGCYATDTVISAIANAVDDMRPYLEGWCNLVGTGPPLHLASFLSSNARAGTSPRLRRRLGNPWLQDRREQEAQIRGWLLANATTIVDKLEAARAGVTAEDALALLRLGIAIASRHSSSRSTPTDRTAAR